MLRSWMLLVVGLSFTQFVAAAANAGQMRLAKFEIDVPAGGLTDVELKLTSSAPQAGGTGATGIGLGN